MRIGLYGGSFDPVHLGHLLVAQAAVEELGLDRIIFIPAGESPFKPGRRMAPAPVRLRLLRLALAGCPQYEVDDLEIRRGGVSYTIDTVRALAASRPGVEWTWLIGADHLPTLDDWKEVGELVKLVAFVVIPRPGQNRADAPSGIHCRMLRGWPIGLSASEIRARVLSGRSVRHLVPSAVAESIERDGIYSNPEFHV